MSGRSSPQPSASVLPRRRRQGGSGETRSALDLARGASMKHHLAGLALLAVAFTCALPFVSAPAQQAPDPDNTLAIELKGGRVLIKLRPDLAPAHVKRVKNLAKEGFYDGLAFHRVIPGFMAQTGDPEGTGAGGSKYVDLK